MSSKKTRTVAAAAVAALALVLAQVALAESPVVRFTAADQAAARTAVLKAADLGAGWKGGLQKNAQALSGDNCPGLWEPKQSDLVITGVAKSDLSAAGVRISSAVQVYKTTRMARLDWERTVVHPAVVPCMKRQAAAERDPSFHLVSLKSTPFPRIGNQAAFRVRMVADYKPKGVAAPVLMLVDVIAFGRGRTGVSMSFTVPYRDRAAAGAVEVRLARLVVSRIRA
jgi:hypothetical protein